MVLGNQIIEGHTHPLRFYEPMRISRLGFPKELFPFSLGQRAGEFELHPVDIVNRKFGWIAMSENLDTVPPRGVFFPESLQMCGFPTVIDVAMGTCVIG